MKNHLEAECFKKCPDKTPQWYTDLKGRQEAAGSVEYEPSNVAVSSIEAEKKAIVENEEWAGSIQRLLHKMKYENVMAELQEGKQAAYNPVNSRMVTMNICMGCGPLKAHNIKSC